MRCIQVPYSLAMLLCIERRVPCVNSNSNDITKDYQLGGPKVSPLGTVLYGQACQSQPYDHVSV